LVGRDDERRAVAELVWAAAAGRAGTVLVSGEAGAGKTVLLERVGVEAAGTVDLLWASCLPLTSLAVPFLPLLHGLREWQATHTTAVSPLTHGRAAADVAARFDAWLDEVCRRRPLLLVIDDLQWADQSTLDVLMYAVAGPAQRRLAVAATVRSGEVGEGHPLRRWLADVRRLPRVSEIDLSRLDRTDTRKQVEVLFGRPPHESLVDDVFERGRGNPYLTELLVRGLRPDTRRLPVDMSGELRDAVARTWHQLTAPARGLTRLVAVAGRPQPADHLTAVAANVGLDGARVVPLLREAVDGAVLVVDAQRRYWFTHPLLAEVLTSGLLPQERQARHTAYAALLESTVQDPAGDAAADVERVVDLADHHHRAGNTKAAYRWALTAAGRVEQAGGTTEALRLLRRALDLHGDLSDADHPRVDLLHRLRTAAERAGEHEQELAAVDDLLGAIDRDRQPLQVAELLVRRMLLLVVTGRRFASLPEVEDAMRLTSRHPESPQHALAAANLAYAELWNGVEVGRARAWEAVRLARACGSPRALSYALTATVMARVMHEKDAVDVTAWLADASEATAAAAQVRDFWAYAHASMWAANCVEGNITPAGLDVLRRGREELTALGAPHPYIARHSAVEALGLLLLGQRDACDQRLRVALGSNPGPMADTDARLIAALLACWQGRLGEAHGHLARAEEIFAQHFDFVVANFDAVRAELAVAEGNTERAVAAALTGASRKVNPTFCERLMPLAARALADEAQAARDRGDDPAAALAKLDQLRRRFPQVISDFGPGEVYQAQLDAMQALYDAETHRAHADPDAAQSWADAATACRRGYLAWDEAYTQWRAAQTLLSQRTDRHRGEAALRRAHELATELDAIPLLREIDAVARAVRLSLTAPAAAERPDTGTVLLGLTAREREILGHLMAGRTYRQIAERLVISQKTVSVHISNMLRKTGTANRIELTQLAHRLTGAGTADRPPRPGDQPPT
jgi:DNA-binding CsgD family transcriptional regulator